jgi:hypothetical protein
MDGQFALKFSGLFMCWRAGVYQRVPVTAGQWLRFSAHVFTWSNSGGNFELPSDLNTYQSARVGLDPLGGVDPRNSRVEWVGPVETDDNYTRLAVDTLARAGFVTAFVEYNLGYKHPGECMWAVTNNWGYADAAALEVIP